MRYDTRTTTLDVPIGTIAPDRTPGQKRRRQLPLSLGAPKPLDARNSRGTLAGWRGAQALAAAALLMLFSELLLTPQLALRSLWYGLVPLLPALFLIHPGLWRNVCPVATLNMAAGRRSLGRKQPPRLAPRIGAVGMALFLILVPARRFLFDVDVAAVAVVVAVCGGMALTLGFLFDRKAGFCNAICPMLPIERLYGQAPLLTLANPRCDGCSLCTARGCIDLTPRKSIAQLLGRSRRSASWLLQPFGAFAAGFPGFVLGYFLAPSGGPEVAGAVYLTVAAASLGSYLLVAFIAIGLQTPSSGVIPGCAVAAASFFYWFSATDISRAWGWDAPGIWTIRIVAFALIGLWLKRRVARAAADSP